MKYDILKFDSTYGPPFYRVRLKRFPWSSWIRNSEGSISTFETKEAAHSHMRALARTTPPTPIGGKAAGQVAA